MTQLLISLMVIFGLSMPVFADEPQEVLIYYVCKGILVDGEVTPIQCVEVETSPIENDEETEAEETEKQST